MGPKSYVSSSQLLIIRLTASIIRCSRCTCNLHWTLPRTMIEPSFRQEFLFYHQKDSDTSDDLLNPVTPWAQMMRLVVSFAVLSELLSSASISLSFFCSFADNLHRRPGSRPTRPYADGRSVPDAERLIKQTYSVHVSLPVDRPKAIVRKWHLSKL